METALLRFFKNAINSFLHPKAKNKTFRSQHAYADLKEAEKGLELAKNKLWNINEWSNLKGINSEFILYDEDGKAVKNQKLEKDFYIKIILPGFELENWVHISKIKDTHLRSEFTVHPSEAPFEKRSKNATVKHFFIKEASSTFGVELINNILYSFENGKNEAINNKGKEAGERKAINTLIAKGGWIGFQKLQWLKLTEWLVHNEE